MIIEQAWGGRDGTVSFGGNQGKLQLQDTSSFEDESRRSRAKRVADLDGLGAHSPRHASVAGRSNAPNLASHHPREPSRPGRALACSLQGLEKRFAIGVEATWSKPSHGAELGERSGASTCDLEQGHVPRHDIGRHLSFFGELGAQRTEGLEDGPGGGVEVVTGGSNRAFASPHA